MARGSSPQRDHGRRHGRKEEADPVHAGKGQNRHPGPHHLVRDFPNARRHLARQRDRSGAVRRGSQTEELREPNVQGADGAEGEETGAAQRNAHSERSARVFQSDTFCERGFVGQCTGIQEEV